MTFSNRFSSLLCLLALTSPATSAFAQDDHFTPEDWAFHAQLTNVTQLHPAFRAPYSGENSLSPRRSQNETTDITFYLGWRLWQGAELWLNPEIDQGFGLSNTVGMAGYPSGEAYKIGANRPYLRLPRAFVRHVIELGGETQTLESGANQLATRYSSNNLSFTVGHFSVVDVFDNNSYAHDPRSDFLNWSVIDAGAFDYAADSWGFTNGASAEWNQNQWSWRVGLFQLSSIPNAKISGLHLHQQSWVTEFEKRTQWLELSGKVKLMLYANRGDMATYTDAIAATQSKSPDLAKVRRSNTKTGASLNLEQAFTKDIAGFLRASVSQGDREAYEFTEINRSLLLGLNLSGRLWQRAEDKVGIAMVHNAISSEAQAYFRAGGSGILIGDGQLRYGPEQIKEAYYSLSLHPNLKLSLDYQRASHPAYNRDRGPVNIYGLRLHAEL